MADKPTKAELAKLPGGEHFDFESATPEEFDKHTEILRRRKAVADLTAPVQQVALVDAPAAGTQPVPTGDIKAVKNGETRYFNQLTWDSMETKGEHDGWEIAVEKPKD